LLSNIVSRRNMPSQYFYSTSSSIRRYRNSRYCI
jgi:hypothetical protein